MNANPALTSWDVTAVPGVANDIWTEVGVAGAYDVTGFKYTGGGRTMRWGTNTVEDNNFYVSVGVDVVSTRTRFDLSGGSNETQALLGDSGSAVFSKVAGNWQLSGITFAISGGDTGYDHQPSNTAVYGNWTFMADLSYYRPQIMALMVPEPGTPALLAATAALLARRRRCRLAN